MGCNDNIWLSDLATKLNLGILSAAVNAVILKHLCYVFDRSFVMHLTSHLTLGAGLLDLMCRFIRL